MEGTVFSRNEPKKLANNTTVLYAIRCAAFEHFKSKKPNQARSKDWPAA
jgi:hypothetical protein